MKSLKAFFALLLALTLFAAACGSDDAVETVIEAEPAAEAEEAEAEPAAEPADEAMSMPGEGVEVTMARASWSTGYFQAETYRLMMEELGYTVSDPADLELDPSLAFLSMSQGEFDFWVNSWYPGHLSWHEADLPDGSQVGDHITRVGNEMAAGGLQGFLITKSVAEDNGIQTLDQIFADETLSALFDQDGDGSPELYGCPDSWTCDNIITEMACQFDWPITQVQAGYDSMIAEAQGLADDGEPMIIYTWTPSAYITKLIPGDNVMWISAEGEVDDQNCSGQENAEQYAQPNSVAAMGEESCLFNSAGECRLAWTAADIQVTANTEWLDANPAAAELLEQVVMPLIDVALANVEQDATDGSTEAIRAIAERWIAANRDVVDGWLDAARAAA